MRRLASFLLPASMLVLAGCPIYDDDCRWEACYDYPDDTPRPPPASSSGGTGYSCSDPSECFADEICSSWGECTTDSCTLVGCSFGYECVISAGRAECVAESQGSSSGGSSSGGNPDAGPAPECNSDAECSAEGPQARCLNGLCAAPAQQCVDASQCAGDARCADGVCTQACDDTSDCPSGYTCDDHGLCTGVVQACTSSQQCAGGESCVDGRCVPGCGSDASCAPGSVCRFGGCVVDETPSFVCQGDGVPGDGSPGTCAAGSVCLRGSCYIGCDPQIATSCNQADQFNQCKPVELGNASFHVCGSDDSLGDECNTAEGAPCSPGLICLDGYCR